MDLPGSIFEFGAWYGSNLVLFENLRAIMTLTITQEK